MTLVFLTVLILFVCFCVLCLGFPSFFPYFLPSFFPSFGHSFLSSFLHSFNPYFCQPFIKSFLSFLPSIFPSERPSVHPLSLNFFHSYIQSSLPLALSPTRLRFLSFFSSFCLYPFFAASRFPSVRPTVCPYHCQKSDSIYCTFLILG